MKWTFVLSMYLTILISSKVGEINSCRMLNAINTNISFVGRNEWGARDPKLVEKFSGQIPFVIIHHSYRPAVSFDSAECGKAMRIMQDMHQLTNDWNDIGYSFAICGDGKIYQGRGYNVIGAHAPRYNDKSIGICLIGDWRFELPPEQMLKATKDLIAYSLENGYLSPNYKVLGHRQVRATECPGQRLYEEIATWDHYSKTPSGPSDTNIPPY
ncbi:hypothetical protein PVAND_001500 [Polypedilum vanderplanki]|uniref:Peptidoglycan-recognition protein n=1 Tax=Polypedilum vanderplanki TaxID=319348 RepID=A0A9J6BNL9_POLVA|nr:hypothetical protein PVAND_001500 [Polypedilum vanderplanki]